MTGEKRKFSTEVTSAGPSDVDLLRAAQDGRQEALAALVERYQHFAYGLALRLSRSPEEAEDVVQDAVLGFIKSLPNLAPDRFAMRGWLGAIVTKCARYRRRGTLRRREREVIANEDKTEKRGEEEPGELSELQEAIRRELTELPEEYRLPIQLRFMDECSLPEIAACLQIHEKTAARHLKLGLIELRRRLRQAGISAAPVVAMEALRNATPNVYLPAGLSERLLQLTANPSAATTEGLGAAAIESLRSGVGATGFFSSGAAALVFGCATLLGVVGWQVYPHLVPPSAATAGSVSVEEPAEMKLLGSWTFENGIPEEIKVLQGRLIWRKDHTGQPGLAGADPDAGAYLLLPYEFSDAAYCVRIYTKNVIFLNEPGGFNMTWVKGDRIPGSYHKIFRDSKVTDFYDMRFNRRQAVGLWSDDAIAFASAYEETNDAREAALYLRNIWFRKIELFELPAEIMAETTRKVESAGDEQILRQGEIAEFSLSKRAFAERPKISKRWTFDVPPGDDFQPREGRWTHVPGTEKKPGALRTRSGAENRVVVSPALRLGVRPFVVTLRLRGVESGPAGVNFGWVHERGSFPNVAWSKRVALTATNEIEQRIFFFDRYIVSQINGQTSLLLEYDTPHPSASIYLAWHNYDLESCEIQEVSLEEIPEEIQNIERLKTILRLRTTNAPPIE